MKQHKAFFLFALLLGLGIFTSAQSNKQTIIKSNLLNIVMIPSIHIEQQIGTSSSLQANFHRGSIVFISPNEFIHTSIDYRKYVTKNKQPDLAGFYLSSGINLYHNYLGTKVDEHNTPIGNGVSNLGVQFKLGYQWIGKNKGLSFDIGTGILTDFYTFQNTQYNEKQTILRLNASLGYNLGRFCKKNKASNIQSHL